MTDTELEIGWAIARRFPHEDAKVLMAEIDRMWGASDQTPALAGGEDPWRARKKGFNHIVFTERGIIIRAVLINIFSEDT